MRMKSLLSMAGVTIRRTCCIWFAWLACLPAVALATPLQWTVASGGNGHFYDYVAASLTWDQAQAAAAATTFNGMQGYLATITSAGENNFIINNFNHMGFLGGSDAAVEGEWRWVVGPEAGLLFFIGEYPDPNRHTIIYADWGSNEPNDFDNTRYGFPYPGEDYLNFNSARGGEWNDVPGAPYASQGYYVEFGPAVPEPSTLLLVGEAALFALAIALRRRGMPVFSEEE